MTPVGGARIKFPQLKLSSDERLWLDAAYNKLLQGETLNPEETRVILHEKLHEDFEWQRIDTRLLRNGKLTLLGILHVAPETDLADTVHRVIESIRGLIKQNPRLVDVTAKTLH